MREMASSQETVLERQARMRERVKSLRDKRETERLALVEKKLDQRWRYIYYTWTLYIYIVASFPGLPPHAQRNTQ